MYAYTRPIQASIDATGSPLTDEALNAAKNADAVLLGAIGGPVRVHHIGEIERGGRKRKILMKDRNGARAPSVRSRAF